MTAPKPHSWIAGLNPYVPGRATADGVVRPVKLSANESTFGASPNALAVYKAEAENMLRYPDGSFLGLVDAIASTYELEHDMITCGAGSDELLTMMIHAYVGQGDEVIHSQYGFMVYPIVTKAVGGIPIAVPNKNWAADVDGILAAVTDKTKIVCVDNPNNPTGAYVSWTEIERLHAGLPSHVLLVLDAAYAECVTAEDYKAGIELARARDNVVMTRTFSKMYALAGLRVGWMYGAKSVVETFNKVRMPFNVSKPAQHAAIAAVKDQDHLHASVDYNSHWRAELAASITALGLSVVPSQTNFLLIGFPTDKGLTAGEANDYLAKNGYLLRWLPGLGLKDHLRLTIGKPQENNAVVQLLTAFMNGSPS